MPDAPETPIDEAAEVEFTNALMREMGMAMQNAAFDILKKQPDGMPHGVIMQGTMNALRATVLAVQGTAILNAAIDGDASSADVRGVMEESIAALLNDIQAHAPRSINMFMEKLFTLRAARAAEVPPKGELN